jgi:hypothetical protein
VAERPRLTLLRPRVAHVVERAWACSEHRFLVPHVYFLFLKSNNRLEEESAVPALPPMPLDAYVKEEEVQVAPPMPPGVVFKERRSARSSMGHGMPLDSVVSGLSHPGHTG